MGSVIPVSLTEKMPGTPIELGEGAGTNDVVITADGTTAYVTNEYTNSVTRIDLATGELGTPIGVGSEPVALDFVPGTDEQWVWVANYDGKSISTINVATGELGSTIAVPHAGPNTIAFTPDGRTCYVANWGTTDKAGSTVTPIEVTDGGAGGRVLPSINVGLNPNWIAITGDGSTAYVAIAGSTPEIDAVMPLDLTATPATLGTIIPLAPKSQPHWIGFTPDGLTAYVVGNGNSTLTPITVASGTPGTAIPVSKDTDSDLLAIAIVPTP